MASGTVTINIVGDASRLKSALGDADSHLGSFSSRVGRLGETMAGVFGGLTLDRAAMAVGSFFRGAFEEAEESIKVTRETARVIESMGGVANVTASQVEKLATAISNKTGVDDEQIQSASNLLLTFGNVRNEVGKGNKIFDQATKLSLDMATVMKTDVRSAAMQVGKALNDPIAGLTALRRAGVQFTDQQEDQIKTMVAAGDVMGAQKMILGELSREFAGAAEKSATPFEKLQTRFKNIQEEIGLKLMPVLVSVSDWFLTTGIPAVESFVGWIQENWPKVQNVIEAAWTVIGPILSLLADALVLYVKAGVEAVKFAVEDAWPVISSVIQTAWSIIEPILSVLATVALTAVRVAVEAIQFAAEIAWPILSSAVSTAWAVIDPILGLMGVAIGAVVAAVGWIAANAGAAWGALQSGISAAWGVIEGPLDALRELLNSIWSIILGIVGAAKDAAQAIGKIPEKVKGAVPDVTPWGGLLPDLNPFAAGGSIPGPLGAGVPILAHGGEVVLNASQVKALNQGAMLVGAPGRGSDGGQTVINLMVNAGMGADGPALGQKIVEVIKQYENRSGTRWRSN